MRVLILAAALVASAAPAFARNAHPTVSRTTVSSETARRDADFLAQADRRASQPAAPAFSLGGPSGGLPEYN